MLPCLTNAVVAALIFQQFFNLHYGIIIWVLDFFGIDKINWFREPTKTPVILSITVFWPRNTGWNVILYLAGLQMIPKEFYEAADMDGAGNFRKHMFITIPILPPIMSFAVTLSIISGMELFVEPYVMVNNYLSAAPLNKDRLTVAVYVIYLIKRINRFGREEHR
ncbi:MAG: sugar ABC transporter permease [Spirochaetales bacterium]|nr:sugar ABC transporter permease [Spirochaetales bacterium]